MTITRTSSNQAIVYSGQIVTYSTGGPTYTEGTVERTSGIPIKFSSQKKIYDSSGTNLQIYTVD